MPAGRPKTTVDILWDTWPQDILDIYEEGGSDEEVRALICRKRIDQKKSFSTDLWYRWIEENEEFSETIKMGNMLSHGWWSNNGRTNLRDKDFSSTLWYMNMKNRFGWRDKQDITMNDKDIQPVVVNLGTGAKPE